MSVFTTSYVVNFIMRIGNVLYEAYTSSRFLNIISYIIKTLLAWCEGSVVIQYFGRTEYMDKKLRSSLVFRIVSAIVSFPTHIGRKIYAKLKPILSSSYVHERIVFLIDHLEYALGIYICILFIVPYEQWNNLYSFIATIVFTLLFIVKTSIYRTSKIRMEVISLSGFIFAMVVVFGFFTSLEPMMSLRHLLFYIDAFLLFMLLVSELDSMKKIARFMKIYLVGVTGTGVYALIQWVQGVPVSPAMMDLTIESNNVGRVYSTIGNPNNFAELLVLSLLFYIVVIGNEKKAKSKLIWGIMAVPVVLALALTYSRSSWIGFAFAVSVFLLFYNWKILPVIGILALALFPFLPDTISGRIMTIFTGDSSSSMRFIVWKQTLPLLKDYWRTGIGLGSDLFFYIMQRYDMIKRAVHSHNIFLQLFIELGIIGIFSFLGIQIRFLRDSIKTVHKNIDVATKRYIYAGISGILGYLLIGLAEFTWHDHRIMLAYFITAGVLMASVRNANEASRSEDNN